MAKARIRRDPSLKGNGMATAGLAIGYGVLLLGIGTWVVIVLYFKQAFQQVFQQAQQAQQEMAKNHPPGMTIQPKADAPTQPALDASDIQPAAHNNFGWTLDVKNAPFPDSPVSGKIHGADFTGKRPTFKNGSLKISSASGGESLTIQGLDPSIENSSYVFQLASGNDPKIEITWSEDGQTKSETFSTGYAMKLKFGPAIKRKVRVQIYLCLPDNAKSYVAGTFALSVPKPKQ